MFTKIKTYFCYVRYDNTRDNIFNNTINYYYYYITNIGILLNSVLTRKKNVIPIVYVVELHN